MSVTSIIIGTVVLTVCFGLMVWGKNYLGEEAGRNPKKPGSGDTTESIDHPCRKCGSCGQPPE
jgi:hypothetical protein